MRGGTTCALAKYPNPTTQKIDSNKASDIKKFIKEKLDLEEQELEKLNQFYSQIPGGFSPGALIMCLSNSGRDNLVVNMKPQTNLYRGKDNKIYLEVVVKNPSLLDTFDDLKEIGYIPGQLVYDFVLTDNGFKLDSFATNNVLLYDLTMQNRIENIKERLKESLEDSSEVFTKYFNKPEVQKLITYNLRITNSISRMFDVYTTRDTVNPDNLLTHHNYVASQRLLSNISTFWKKENWDSWRDLALHAAIEALFDDEGNIRKEIADTLNGGGFNISSAQTKVSLLTGFYSTFVVSPFHKNLKNIGEQSLTNFYDKNSDVLPEDFLGTPDQKKKAINDIWIRAPLKKLTPETINEFISSYKKKGDMDIDKERNFIPPQPSTAVSTAKPIAEEASKPGFFATYWPYFAVGLGIAVVVTGLVLLGIFTFGLGPTIVAGVGLILAVELTEAAALAIGTIAIVLSALIAYTGTVLALEAIAPSKSSSTKTMQEGLGKEPENVPDKTNPDADSLIRREDALQESKNPELTAPKKTSAQGHPLLLDLPSDTEEDTSPASQDDDPPSSRKPSSNQ